MKINYFEIEEVIKGMPKEEAHRLLHALLNTIDFKELKESLHDHIDSQTPENFYPTLQVLVEVLEHYKDAVEALKEGE